MTELHSYMLCVGCKAYIKPSRDDPHAFKRTHSGSGHKIVRERVDIDLDRMSEALRNIYFKTIV
jgi:hypothetical protein